MLHTCSRTLLHVLVLLFVVIVHIVTVWIVVDIVVVATVLQKYKRYLCWMLNVLKCGRSQKSLARCFGNKSEFIGIALWRALVDLASVAVVVFFLRFCSLIFHVTCQVGGASLWFSDSFFFFFVFSPFVFVNVAHNEKIVKRFKIELTNKLDLFYDFESDY